MSSILESLQKPSFFPSRPLKDALPISQQSTDNSKPVAGLLRRRLSSISFRIRQPSWRSSSDSSSSSSAASRTWAFRRSKSESSILGESASGSIRKWWDWGWAWILSRKPTFARDLEMNEEETAMLGCHSKGSWRHVFYKVRAELRKLVGSTHCSSATPVFSYDSYSYAQNFDDGNNANREG